MLFPVDYFNAIVLWNTYGDCSNYGQLKGHKKAVLDLQWSRDSRVIYSASADCTVGTWDSETGQRIRKHTGHEDIVNCVATMRRGTEFLATGSDDATVSVRKIFFDADLLISGALGWKAEICSRLF